MPASHEKAPSRAFHPVMGFASFVVLIAALMAITALAIDSMLPALPAISASLGLVDENQRQWIITSYLIGFGAVQIIIGPLADRFGRKPLLLSGLLIYGLASLGITFTSSFETMMVLRVIQGIGAASPRVLTVSIVRDSYSGREMSRVMSLAMIVFLAVPILAPSIGQVIMLFGPWRWIFGALAIVSLVLAAWVALRLPETLRPENRTLLSFRGIADNFAICFTNRIALGYMLAMAAALGGLFGFINSAQQIFVDVYAAPQLFTTIFALVAAAMALSSLVNSRLVVRLGMRVISHAALVGYIVFAMLHALTAWAGIETLWIFTLLQAAVMFCFGILAPNFGAMAMDPLGRMAGTASAVQGFVTTIVGAFLGFIVGQQFNGTTLPFGLGMALCGWLALGATVLAENGRLFRPSRPA
jgi:DHA1 family bicyclomycin/chloramphenicol resistance-like MFS transporter